MCLPAVPPKQTAQVRFPRHAPGARRDIAELLLSAEQAAGPAQCGASRLCSSPRVSARMAATADGWSGKPLVHTAST